MLSYLDGETVAVLNELLALVELVNVAASVLSVLSWELDTLNA